MNPKSPILSSKVTNILPLARYDNSEQQVSSLHRNLITSPPINVKKGRNREKGLLEENFSLEKGKTEQYGEASLL